jgi:hypothetical protein
LSALLLFTTFDSAFGIIKLFLYDIKFENRSDKYLFIWMISYKDPERSSLMCSWIENLTTEREILLVIDINVINVQKQLQSIRGVFLCYF